MKRVKKQKFIGCVIGVFLLLIGHSVSIAQTEDEENNIAIYGQVGQGVVNITTIAIERDFFFNPVPKEGAGSGSIIDADGHILTNYHVVQGARRLEVTLYDESKWPAKFIGADPDNDLAVIMIDTPKEKLTVIPMGDSDTLEVGQKVLAIGNPFGLGQTLTTGIISSLGRSIRAQNGTLIEEVIQTDAAINPGNSGGPLLDSDGKIIGVNSAIISPTGASVGIGFAVPVNTARRILSDLITKGHVAYPWIGISMYPLIPEFAEFLNLKAQRGVIIAEVVQGGPADRAGLRGGDRQVQVGNSLIPIGGDVIIEINGNAVSSPNELIRHIRDYQPGDNVKFRILREGKFLDIDVILGEKPFSQ
ncbi:MAG: S1C family serine protease [Candidatus Odinarchaeota archaeon]